MQESILCIFIKIWSYYPKVRELSYFVMLEAIILLGAMNKFFKKYLKNVKKYHK